MKKLIFLIFVTAIIVAVLELSGTVNIVVDKQQSTSTPVSNPTDITNNLFKIDNSGYSLYYSDEDEIYIVQIPKSQKIMLEVDEDNPKSLKEFASQEEFSAAINAGFFLEDNSHAGLLIVDGMQNTAFSPNDLQLTHVLTISTSEISVISNQDIDIQALIMQQITAFQAGPLFIDSSATRLDLVDNSFNGRGKYKRTVFAYDNAFNYFIITRKAYTLLELSTNLLSYNIYDGKFTALNLDGGSSTSMYVKGEEKFQINESKVLPNYLYF